MHESSDVYWYEFQNEEVFHDSIQTKLWFDSRYLMILVMWGIKSILKFAHVSSQGFLWLELLFPNQNHGENKISWFKSSIFLNWIMTWLKDFLTWIMSIKVSWFKSWYGWLESFYVDFYLKIWFICMQANLTFVGS